MSACEPEQPWMTVHTRGAATENARSPSLVRLQTPVTALAALVIADQMFTALTSVLSIQWLKFACKLQHNIKAF